MRLHLCLIFRYVQGGMGAVSQAIASSAKEAGASLHTNAKVARILIEHEKACGVVLLPNAEVGPYSSHALPLKTPPDWKTRPVPS